MLKTSMHQVVYQIWPRSFKDSNGDGIGDIPGIISRLDYLKELGIDLIWLSPVFVSPNHDYGYDISDYYNIQPEFGTMADFERLIAEAKARGIGLILDLVANHTSDEHPWYKAALKDPKSKFRDYYVFRQSPGKEPNNWISLFGGSAWGKVEGEPDTWSLNLFTPEQKDLNWENPEVRQRIADIIRFWMDKGITGFRMDVINLIAKKEGLPDYDPHKKGYQFAKDYLVSLPKSHVWLKELYADVLKHYPGLFIGEGVLINPDSASKYSGLDSEELDLMFHFDTMLIGCGPLGKYDFRKLYRWSVKEFKDIYFKWQTASVKQAFMLGNFLSNHDNGRAVSRFGDDRRYHKPSAKALLLFIFASRGTPFIYQGEEIGMTNLKLEETDWKDFEAKNAYGVLGTMMHLPRFLAKKVIQAMTRDQARTPMQWSSDPKAGFTQGEPWMKVNPNTVTINVEAQEKDPTSILNFTKALTRIHHDHPVLTFGTVEPVLRNHKQILGFLRQDEREILLFLFNLSPRPATFKAPETWQEGTLLLSSYPESGPLFAKMVFAPYEARLIQVNSLDREA